MQGEGIFYYTIVSLIVSHFLVDYILEGRIQKSLKKHRLKFFDGLLVLHSILYSTIMFFIVEHVIVRTSDPGFIVFFWGTLVSHHTIDWSSKKLMRKFDRDTVLVCEQMLHVIQVLVLFYYCLLHLV